MLMGGPLVFSFPGHMRFVLETVGKESQELTATTEGIGVRRAASPVAGELSLCGALIPSVSAEIDIVFFSGLDLVALANSRHRPP
jgi:hypothetical protein